MERWIIFNTTGTSLNYLTATTKTNKKNVLCVIFVKTFHWLEMCATPHSVLQMPVTLLAVDLYNIKNVDHTPADYHENIQEQMAWVTALAQKVVDFAWLAPDTEDIKVAASVASTRVIIHYLKQTYVHYSIVWSNLHPMILQAGFTFLLQMHSN